MSAVSDEYDEQAAKHIYAKEKLQEVREEIARKLWQNRVIDSIILESTGISSMKLREIQYGTCDVSKLEFAAYVKGVAEGRAEIEARDVLETHIEILWEECGLSVSQIAEKLELEESEVNRVLRGSKSAKTLMGLLAGHEIDLDEEREERIFG